MMDMMGAQKIRHSAETGMRILASSLAHSAPESQAPHRRQPRRELFAKDKLYCEIINNNPYLWRLPGVPRHRRPPKHARTEGRA